MSNRLHGSATLVTGGAGFIGLGLVELLLQQGHRVVVYDRIAPPAEVSDYLLGLPGKLDIVTGDILDADRLARCVDDVRPSTIVHCATVTPNEASERRDPTHVLRVNYDGAVNVLEQARRVEGTRVICVSSSGVYGDLSLRDDLGQTVRETVAGAPASLYAVSKAAAERIALRYAALFGLNVVIARVGVAFGPWEYDTGVRDPLSVHLELARKAFAGEKAILPRDPSKDWVYNRDVAAALLALMQAPMLKSSIFNISGSSVWSAGAFAQRFKGVFPNFSYATEGAVAQPANIDLHGAKDRPPLDIARLGEEAGFTPRFGIDEAFEDYVTWLRKFSHWRQT